MKYKVSLSILALVILSVTAGAQVQKIMTLAGTGVAGFYGDGINGSSAILWGPIDVKLDTAGNVYFIDFNNYRIRKINSTGLITTVVGSGTAGNSGNGSVATSANIYARGMAIDKRNSIFFTDQTNAIIRKVNSLGIISRFAGTTSTIGYSGDGGKADTAKFKDPQGIATDDKGNIYVCDAGNHVIRKIDTLGFISTIAGTGVAGYFGDLGLATFAQLDSPYAVTVDHIGNVYVNDFNNNVIRKIDTFGVITTVVGSYGVYSYTGDLGLAVNATVNSPRGLAVDANNYLYIADALNNVIRKVDTFGIISTAAGNGSFGFGGDLGFVTGANFKNPYGVAVDKYRNIYIGDANNNRIRKTYYTTGVNNNTIVNAGIEEYPNPAGNSITLTDMQRSDVVSVFDITGRQIGESRTVSNDGDQVFDISSLDKGLYTVQVTGADGNKKATLKLVKQ